MTRSTYILVSFLAVINFGMTEAIGGGNNNDSLSINGTIADELDIELCPEIPAGETVEVYNPDFLLSPELYKERYNEKDLLYKITDNWGNGYDPLYGTRNVRTILHGIAYRGGANNFFHKENKRSNQNPLPPDGVENLCKEGFAHTIYLYRTNFDKAPAEKKCDCIEGEENNMEYSQFDYFDDKHVYEMLKIVHKSAVNDELGPVYLHCWNGWHASGFLSAVILKQFCGYSDLDAVNYWDLGTDGANKSPRYTKIRDRIKNFKPYPELIISDSLGNRVCPKMPEVIDSSQLHITLEHLAIVPEAIPLNYKIVMERVKFKPYKTSLVNPSSNKDLLDLIKALETQPELKVEIGGHTDNTGKYAQNVSISKQRAGSVYNHLIAKGIPAERMVYKGYGSAKPRYTNRYKWGRDGNRRIEIKILQKKAHNLDKLADDGAATTIKKEPITVSKEPIKTTPKEEVKKETPKKEAVEPPKISLRTLDDAPKGTNIILSNVAFPPYSYSITDKNKGDVLKLAQMMKANPNMRVEIGGHTDSSGDPAGNKTLSKQRAKAVHDYIIKQGVDSNRLIYKGYGHVKPKYNNKYKWGRDHNRRIEVTIIKPA
jgi:outer membrane protein OmpA-like peptidoglycan-associated protein